MALLRRPARLHVHVSTAGSLFALCGLSSVRWRLHLPLPLPTALACLPQLDQSEEDSSYNRIKSLVNEELKQYFRCGQGRWRPPCVCAACPFAHAVGCRTFCQPHLTDCCVLPASPTLPAGPSS